MDFEEFTTTLQKSERTGCDYLQSHGVILNSLASEEKWTKLLQIDEIGCEKTN